LFLEVEEIFGKYCELEVFSWHMINAYTLKKLNIFENKNYRKRCKSCSGKFF